MEVSDAAAETPIPEGPNRFTRDFEPLAKHFIRDLHPGHALAPQSFDRNDASLKAPVDTFNGITTSQSGQRATAFTSLKHTKRHP